MYKLMNRVSEWRSGADWSVERDWCTRPQASEWRGAWKDIDPGIITHDIVPKLREIGSAVRVLEGRLDSKALDEVKRAASHLLNMCFKDGRSPSAIRPTADDGIVFYFYPFPATFEIYVCLEIYDDGEVVAAWSNGYADDAWDLGLQPSEQAVADALKEIDALVSTTGRGRT